MSTDYYWTPGLSFRFGFRLNGGINRLPTKYELLQQAYLTNQDVFGGTEYSSNWPYVQQIRVGNSACGWAFNLHVLPDLGITDLEDWIVLMEYGSLEDEYSRLHNTEEFIEDIQQRACDRKQHKPRLRPDEPVQLGVNNLLMPFTGGYQGYVYKADPTKTYFCSL
jgi:hypothetical protein